MNKQYDQDYFDTWYRQRGINNARHVARKAALALSVAEYHLCRPVRSVLDVGCGEGVWRAPLLKLRPDLHYLGLDASEYAVSRYGRRRNLRLAKFADLAELRFHEPFDLIVCSDVLHYLGDDEIQLGLTGFRDLCYGTAFIEVFCVEDDVEGDMDHFRMRGAEWYRRTFAQAGLTACGNHCYLLPDCAGNAVALETLTSVSP